MHKIYQWKLEQESVTFEFVFADSEGAFLAIRNNGKVVLKGSYEFEARTRELRSSRWWEEL